VGGRTRHITVRTNFLRELKEQGLLRVEWIPAEENSSDMFTKNLQGPLFEKHASVYVSDMLSTDSQREGVGGRVSSHGQLVIESHAEHGSGHDEKQGSGFSARSGRKPKEKVHVLKRNNNEGQDLDWKSVEGQDLDWKSLEGQESVRKPEEGYI